MVDRPPPSRYSVVERGGRLVVIDTQTGRTPPTAAERMDNHDRAMGIEPNRPARAAATPAPAQAAPPTARAAKAQPKAARPAPADPAKARMAAKVAEMQNRPWTQAKAERPAPRPDPAPAPARIPERPAPQAGGRKTIVTGKWWDSKGPRTIELGPKGQQTLSGGFVTLFFVVLIAAMVVLFIEPIILFVGAFLLFRFGSNILGPIGAGIVDKALAERN